MKNARYFEFEMPIDTDKLPDLPEGSAEGTRHLQVEVYYMKDARTRGLKLSISRVRKHQGFVSMMPMSKYNGYLNLHNMPRKNDRVAAKVAAVVEKNIEAICEVALESEKPDFQSLFPILTPQIEQALA